MEFGEYALRQYAYAKDYYGIFVLNPAKSRLVLDAIKGIF